MLLQLMGSTKEDLCGTCKQVVLKSGYWNADGEAVWIPKPHKAACGRACMGGGLRRSIAVEEAHGVGRCKECFAHDPVR